MSPQLERLSEVLKTEPDARPWLIRAAIGDTDLSKEITALAQRWSTSSELEERRLGLLLGDRLGLKDVAKTIAQRLNLAPSEWLKHQGLTTSDATLAQDAVVFVTRVSSPGSQALHQALEFALSSSETRVLGWNGLPPEELTSALPWIDQLLREAPQLANQVASRFALLAREECPALCTALAGADDDVRTIISNTLKKNLKRMGKIKLWRASQDALNGRPHP